MAGNRKRGSSEPGAGTAARGAVMVEAALKQAGDVAVSQVEDMGDSALVEELLERYGDMPLRRIPDMDSVETVSPTWERRPKSNIVKWLMRESGRTLDDVAVALGCSKPYLNNKLHRDSFSVDDLVAIAYACGYAMTFSTMDANSGERRTIQVDAEHYFAAHDGDTRRRLRADELRMQLRKRGEYEELKARLAQMKAEYGFED